MPPQTMPTFEMKSVAEQLLSTDYTRIQADNVVRSDRFARFDDDERFHAVRFNSDGTFQRGWWSPRFMWRYQSEILEGAPGTFYNQQSII